MDNQIYIFIPTYFELNFRTIILTQMEKKIRVGTKNGRAPEPDCFYLA